MKVRLYANSIRLRLSRPEVQQIAGGKPLEERLNLMPAPLTIRLNTADDTAPTAAFDGKLLSITAGRTLLAEWAENDKVGIESEKGDAVHVLIEKDFECLHGDSENQADCFPNPLAAAE